MATLVLEQDESVKMIETQAVQVNTDVENGSATLHGMHLLSLC